MHHLKSLATNKTSYENGKACFDETTDKRCFSPCQNLLYKTGMFRANATSTSLYLVMAIGKKFMVACSNYRFSTNVFDSSMKWYH